MRRPRQFFEDGPVNGEEGNPGRGPEGGEGNAAGEQAPCCDCEAESYEPREEPREEDMVFIGAAELLLDSFRLARKVWEDGYHPNFLLAIWRGGTFPGMVIHEFLRYKGHDPYHTSIKTQSYKGFRRGESVEIKGLEHVIDIINAEDRLLIVDDVFDTGHTIRAVLEAIRCKARRNTPHMKVATVYYKPEKNETDIAPDYFLRSEEGWLVFPHEIAGLSPELLRRKGAGVADIVEGGE